MREFRSSGRLAAWSLIAGVSVAWLAAAGGEEPLHHLYHAARLLGEPSAPGETSEGGGPHECVGGMADIYPCNLVDLLAHLPLSAIGGGSGSDIWGWTDPVTGKEVALMGRSNGTSFVDITPYGEGRRGGPGVGNPAFGGQT